MEKKERRRRKRRRKKKKKKQRIFGLSLSCSFSFWFDTSTSTTSFPSCLAFILTSLKIGERDPAEFSFQPDIQLHQQNVNDLLRDGQPHTIFWCAEVAVVLHAVRFSIFTYHQECEVWIIFLLRISLTKQNTSAEHKKKAKSRGTRCITSAWASCPDGECPLPPSRPLNPPTSRRSLSRSDKVILFEILQDSGEEKKKKKKKKAYRPAC